MVFIPVTYLGRILHIKWGACTMRATLRDGANVAKYQIACLIWLPVFDPTRSRDACMPAGHCARVFDFDDDRLRTHAVPTRAHRLPAMLASSLQAQSQAPSLSSLLAVSPSTHSRRSGSLRADRASLSFRTCTLL